MKAHGRHGQVVLLTELADLDKVNEVLDLFLHGVQADQTVKLFHQFVKVRFLRFLLLGLRRVCSAPGGLNLGAVLLYKAGLPAGDKVQRIQSLA